MLYKSEKKTMLRLGFFILFIAVEHHNGQINLYSDIDLFDLATQFQPANSVELLNSVVVATLTNCGQCKVSKIFSKKIIDLFVNSMQ